MSPNWGFMGTPIQLDNYTMLPYSGVDFGETEAIDHYKNWDIDVLVTMYDVWPLARLAELVKRERIIWTPYVPVDFSTLIPAIGERLESATYIVPYTKYAEDKIRRAGFTNCWNHIYHGVDKVFKPIVGETTQDGKTITKERLRKDLGFPDNVNFIIGIGKMNKGTRPGIPRMLEGIKIFLENNPDMKNSTGIYLHCGTRRRDGFDLLAVLKMLGLQEITRSPKDYNYFIGYNTLQMAKMYNALDVVLNATQTEGFGYPIIESMACGVPVIATDCMSMAELLKPITPELLVKPIDTIWVQVPGCYYIPDKYEIADKIELVLNTDPEKYRKKLSEHARKTFDWDDVIIPQWCKFFEFLEGYVDTKCLKIPEPGAELRKLAGQVEVI